MQINPIQENTSFKQIRLNEIELNKAKNIYRQIINNPKNHEFNLKLFDLFEKHLNNEVALKGQKPTKALKSFATRLYNKFFEILNTTKYKEQPFESFFDNLNNFSDKFTLNENANEQVFTYNFNVTTANQTANYICKVLDISHEAYLKLVQKNPNFQHLTVDRFNNEIEEIRNFLDFEKEEFIEILKKSPYTMTQPSQTTINDLKNIKNVLYPDDNEQYKDLFRVNPNLLNLTNDKFKIRLKELSDFFEIDEYNVIAMIRAQSFLATMPMNHIIENFNSMQEHLNIDSEKMKEIATIAPNIVRKEAKYSINDYKNIAESLNMPYEKFIAWSLTTPAIFRNSPGKLEKVANYLSNELDFSRENTLNYISQNLNILSYRYKNMSERKDGNFDVLNKELEIDYNTYKSLLAKNSWFFGNDKALTESTLKSVQKYFNQDKETFKKMIIENPVLATIDVQYIDKYLEDTAILLNIDKNEVMQLSIKCPLLATTPVKCQIGYLAYNSKLLGVNERQFIEMCRTNPSLLVERLDGSTDNT